MVTLREYVEEKECEELFSEGFITNTIGRALGIAGVGVLYAWVASLIIKGGKKAVNSIRSTLGFEDRKKFDEAVVEAKKSPAVKEQILKGDSLKKQYEDEIGDVLDAIRKNNVEKAAEEFKKLDKPTQNSTEVKRILIDEITKNFGYVISGDPTPGTPSFKAIRNIMGLQEAKAASAAFEKSIGKLLGEN